MNISKLIRKKSLLLFNPKINIEVLRIQIEAYKRVFIYAAQNIYRLSLAMNKYLANSEAISKYSNISFHSKKIAKYKNIFLSYWKL